jgi:hypothetical protein
VIRFDVFFDGHDRFNDSQKLGVRGRIKLGEGKRDEETKSNFIMTMQILNQVLEPSCDSVRARKYQVQQLLDPPASGTGTIE